MATIARLLALFVLLLPLGLQGQSRTALVIPLEGAIGPAAADFVVRGLDDIDPARHELVILQLDTPGGLDSAMRDIVRAILASPVPVVGYVAPGGARAASAGTFIMYACHVAAMAPGTNLGAATPVQLSFPGMPSPSEGEEPPPVDAKTRKVVNDAVAYIRSLADLRGRNAEWAERAVRRGESLSASQAEQEQVIDLMADDLSALLQSLHGRTVDLHGDQVTLDTAGLQLQTLEPDLRSRVLAVITNPNITFILLLIGIYGLIFEFANPGTIGPGVIGAICLVLALYALQLLPINYAGLALMGLGLAFMLAEFFVPSFGALGIGGVIAFMVGSLLLFDAEGYRVSLPMIGGTALLSSGFFLWLMRRFYGLRRTRPVTGVEELTSSRGEVLADFHGEGRVRVHGEIWKAYSDEPLQAGQKVKVVQVDGLVLHVEKLEEEN